MKTINSDKLKCRISGCFKRLDFLSIAVLLSMLCFAPTASARSDKTNSAVSTTGSGKMYKTFVERHTKGELSDEDYRQISTLGSHIIRHLNEAIVNIETRDIKKVKESINKSLTLVGIIHKMLPVTTVFTTVKDAKETEVYRDTERVQDTQIPIYDFMIETDVIDPIITSRHSKLSVKGIRLDEADVIHTSVFLNLNYIERKLKHAAYLLEKKPNDARKALISAQNEGIRISLEKENNALVEAQRALSLAERMVNEKNYAAAREDLNIARLFLETHTELSGKTKNNNVAAMIKEIDQISKKIDQSGTLAKIRKTWHAITKKISDRIKGIHQEITY